jgi:NTP pyrophosphatase (non-canonical NTP hydrolase)
MDERKMQSILAVFAKERDWDKFHTPKNPSTALMCEAGELAEIFQWMTGDESVAAMSDPITAEAIRDEVADV